MAFRLIDPRQLLGMADPVIPVRLGRLKLAGRISDFEHDEYALIAIKLYHFGPPMQSFTFHRPFAWDQVQDAWVNGHPLLWY